MTKSPIRCPVSEASWSVPIAALFPASFPQRRFPSVVFPASFSQRRFPRGASQSGGVFVYTFEPEAIGFRLLFLGLVLASRV